MYLKRLEIQGFKSFAKKTTLEFDRGITAVVGPNGSGKSNIADCLRWVLGEQSAKMMRGKKSDDVIFAGSDQKGRSGVAEVFATFDNRDKKIPVDSAEVSLGRRVDRSGESEYLINGNRVRLLDIVDLVLKSNIGTSRYTVIGQGTIDQFILQGPSGVKELIDEASGVKTYYLRREKTLRRLEQTAQNLMRAEDLIAEIEPRLKSLRRLAKRMEEREKVENELKILLVQYFGNKYYYLHYDLVNCAEKLDQVEKLRKDKEQLIETMLQATGQSDSQRTARLEELTEFQNKLTTLQHEKNKILEHLSLLRGRLESLKSGSSEDPETLKARLYDINSKLETEQLALQKIAEEEVKTKLNLKDRTFKLTEINRKLESVYAELSSPHEIDTNKIKISLQELDGAMNEFAAVFEAGADWHMAQHKARTLREIFKRFKQTAENELSGNDYSAHKLKAVLQTYLSEKEQIQSLISELSIEVSKVGVAKDYTQKQIEALETEKRRVALELNKASNSEQDFVEKVAREEERLKIEQAEIEAKITAIQLDMDKYYTQEKLEREKQSDHDKQIRDEQGSLSRLRDSEAGFRVEKARVEANIQNLEREVAENLGHNMWPEVKQQKPSEQDPTVIQRIDRLKQQLQIIGGVDELTMQEHRETEMRYEHLTSQVLDLKRAMQDLKTIMDELDEHIASSFNQAFHKIHEKFEYYFRILFNGGRAHLMILKQEEKQPESETENEDVNTDEQKSGLRPEEKLVRKYEKGNNVIVGIDIKATPPGKKLSSIQALSGGERALTSIALLCSLLSSFPSPFVMLDEVDAALDEANTMRFGQILGTLAHQTQFITITHNRETMSQANTIYGVTMGEDGISKLLSVKFDDATQYAK